MITQSSHRPCLKPTAGNTPTSRKPARSCSLMEAAFALSPMTATIRRKPLRVHESINLIEQRSAQPLARDAMIDVDGIFDGEAVRRPVVVGRRIGVAADGAGHLRGEPGEAFLFCGAEAAAHLIGVRRLLLEGGLPVQNVVGVYLPDRGQVVLTRVADERPGFRVGLVQGIGSRFLRIRVFGSQSVPGVR